MAYNKDDLLHDLRRCTIRSVFNKYFASHEVWYFKDHLKLENYAGHYDDIKALMSNRLNIAANNIAIIGSSKLGFSVAPQKAFSEFSDKSDIDIAIICPNLFRQSWSAFRALSQKKYLPNYCRITSNIFNRFVELKDPDPDIDFFRNWSQKIDPCKKDLHTLYSITHDINYRIYDSWQDVEHYHCKGLQELLDMYGEEK